MKTAFSYTLNPTEKQIGLFNLYFSAGRMVYNKTLEKVKEDLARYESNPTRYKKPDFSFESMVDDLPLITLERPWLDEVPKQILHQKISELEYSLNTYFQRKQENPNVRVFFPTFKRRHSTGRFHLTSGLFTLVDDCLRITGSPEPLEVVWTNYLEVQPDIAIFTQDKKDNYYVRFIYHEAPEE